MAYSDLPGSNTPNRSPFACGYRRSPPIASAAAAAVLLLWPHGKPTNTFQFWGALAGAPLVVCLAVFGWKVDRWEDAQTDAEEGEEEQHRLRGMWRDWTRRRLCVVDVAAL